MTYVTHPDKTKIFVFIVQYFPRQTQYFPCQNVTCMILLLLQGDIKRHGLY